MIVPCPNCRQNVELRSMPIRGHANDGSEAWTCLRCSTVVCVDCYHEHTKKKHPEMLKEIRKLKK